MIRGRLVWKNSVAMKSSIRQGNYRILYMIEDEIIIEVAGHRSRRTRRWRRRRRREPSTDLTGVHGIIAEVQAVTKSQPSADIAILVSNQPVVGDHIGIEVHLHFGIESNHLQGGGQVIDEQFLGLAQVNDRVIDPSST